MGWIYGWRAYCSNVIAVVEYVPQSRIFDKNSIIVYLVKTCNSLITIIDFTKFTTACVQIIMGYLVVVYFTRILSFRCIIAVHIANNKQRV